MFDSKCVQMLNEFRVSMFIKMGQDMFLGLCFYRVAKKATFTKNSTRDKTSSLIDDWDDCGSIGFGVGVYFLHIYDAVRFFGRNFTIWEIEPWWCSAGIDDRACDLCGHPTFCRRFSHLPQANICMQHVIGFMVTACITNCRCWIKKTSCALPF